MQKRFKKFCTVMVASAVAVSNLAGSMVVSAEEIASPKQYEIYPVPHSVEYAGGDFNVGTDVNVIYETGIDIYTRNRVEEVLESHNINATVSEGIVEEKTNILVGINDSGESVDTYFNENVAHEESFFEKRDSNLVYVNEGVIGVLGNNTDSSFYGVTTLKHVFNQLEDNVIENFRVDDYADVAYRGFIEGYYGNPWSNEDRAELMKYGGDYKLNQYIFAPKDDPYHNSKWRELYPEAELQEIKKLARVGNETKNRYVYALHPFMYNAVRFNTEENYQADLNVIKAKFSQLLEAEVRQFGILADDAGVPAQGPSSYVKLLNDLTVWLEEQKETYPDLKTDLIFCPNDYMGNGSSTQLKEVNKAGDNVSIVMTGGRIWGEVSQNFTTNFINNIATEGNPGRAPYLWINWPCSDNSKEHLIMGGNNTFLHPGVDPSTVKGIVLNPMQQAEANKSALFAISDYAWNIWDTKADADKNWEDSFKYMDHGTAEDTNSSMALREISKHMINQNMDGRVTALQESVELAPKLNAFKAKYESGASIIEDADSLIEEFTKLKDSAAYYKENPGNPRTRDQIVYWLNCWDDTMDAAIGYLNAAKAVEQGTNDEVWTEYSNAQAAFEKSKTYKFWYVDHYEKAEVGVQHIVPFIKFMGQNLSNIVSSIVDPNRVITSFITNRTDTPSGKIENAFDGKAETEIVYKTPNTINEGTYVGLKYSTQIEINNVQFLMGAAANLNDTMLDAKIQYTEDGTNWVDLNDEVYHLPQDIKIEDINIKAKGIRMVATTTKNNTWLGVRDIIVNKGATDDNSPIEPTVVRTPGWAVYSGSESNLLDDNDNSSVWYKTHTGDMTRVGDYIGLDLGKVINVGKVHFVVGSDNADKWTEYKLEYSTDNVNWTTYKEYEGKASGKDIIDEDLEGVEARYVRLVNLKELNKWVKFSELKVERCTTVPSTANVYTNADTGIKSMYTDSMTNLVPQENITLNSGEYIGVKLNRIKDLSNINLATSNMDGLTLQSSMNAIEWNNVDDSNLADARYVRVIADKTVTFNLEKFEVESNEVYEPSLVSSYTGVYGDGNAKAALDGNLNSSVKFGGAPRTGDTIVYDLGQVININNLKYTVLDTEKDHIRDGKFQVSLDGEEWIDVITIGDGIENPQNDLDSKPGDNGYKHGSISNGIIPISHSYVEGENLDIDARYVRVLFTAGYPYRWSVINEILINNGAYVQTTNDPTYVSNPIEMKGFEPSNVRDGDLTTSYKPNTNNGEITSGSFTYRLSEKTDVKKINIIQSGSEISNAKVMVRTGYTEAGEEIWNEIAVLDKSLNEIVNTKYENIFEIRIDWNGVSPNIYEIITINNYDAPNAIELRDKYEELIKLTGEDYTAESFKVLQDALASAKEVLDNNNASQEEIDNALALLVSAEEGLELNTPEEIVVGKVNNLKADSTNNSVVLTWEAPNTNTGLVEYVIYKDGKELSRVSAGNAEYIVEGLKSNTIYGFKVTSVYSNGEESKPTSINIRTRK
ncbi:beta-N-acetylglucosaminidase domain-containing protein [Clostridium sp.]|uniref:beta-N-acetylglucosaminidase domain-containing protein n=1 Tax=Clostridium sp. TaxID=1506 RepID=UPI003F382B41